MKQWDVFISHASEDKDTIVRPLVDKLRSFSISVWYDENDISLGDSIINNIVWGLEKSHIGIIILSEAFFRKKWTTFELGAMTLKKNVKDQVLIPVYHGIDVAQVAISMPFLADIKAISCHDITMIDAVSRTISLRINELKCTYTNIHNYELEDIAQLFYRKQNRFSTLVSEHINKYNSLIKIDRDMAIVRAKILLQTIIRQLLNAENLENISAEMLNAITSMNNNIREHFKLIFKFAEIAESNDNLENTISTQDIEITTLSLKSILSWYYNSFSSQVLTKERLILPIPIGELTVDDIVESYKIEQQLLRKDLISSVGDVVKWYEYNFYCMHGIRDKATEKLVGFVNAIPLTDESFELMKSGVFPDVNISTAHIRKFDYPDFYKLYISSICIAPEYQNSEAFKILYDSLINIILDLAVTHEVFFTELLSDACTQNGERLSHAIGMKYLRGSTYNTKLYWGTLIPPSLRLRNNMGKSLMNFYNQKFDEFRDMLN